MGGSVELVVSGRPGVRWFVSLSMPENDYWEDLSSSPTKVQAIRNAERIKAQLEAGISIRVVEEKMEEGD